MKKYIKYISQDGKRKYHAYSPEELLTQIKNDNSVTRNLSLEEYIQERAKFFRKYCTIPISDNPTALEIVDCFMHIGNIEEKH